MTRWLRLLIAVVVIAGLIVGLVLVRRVGDRVETAPALTSDFPVDYVSILNIPRETITQVVVQRRDESLLLRADADGRLEPEYQYDVPFVRSRVERIVGSVSSLSSRRLIAEKPEDLEEYGLTDPAIRVTVTVRDSDPVTLLVGNRTPSGDAYYAQTSGGPSVYSVATAWIAPFFYALDDLRDKTMPQIDPQSIFEVVIQTIEGRAVRVSRVPATDEDPEMSLSAFAVTEPFSRRYQASSLWLETVAEALPNIGIFRYADDDPGDLVAYGLQPPVARFRVSDATSLLDLELGEITSDGRFARFSSGGSVFVVRGVEELISVTPYTTLSPFIYIVNIDLMDSIVVESATERYLITIDRAAGENPEDDPVETFYFDGEEMEDELFRDLYQWLIGLQMDAEIGAAATGAADLSITYTLNTGGPGARIEFVPQDSNYYAVYRDGVAEFVVARTKIERLRAVLADPSSIED